MRRATQTTAAMSTAATSATRRYGTHPSPSARAGSEGSMVEGCVGSSGSSSGDGVLSHPVKPPPSPVNTAISPRSAPAPKVTSARAPSTAKSSTTTVRGRFPVMPVLRARILMRRGDEHRLLAVDPGEDQRRGLLAETAWSQLAPQLLGFDRGAPLLDLEHAQTVLAEIGGQALEAEGHHVPHGVAACEGGVDAVV